METLSDHIPAAPVPALLSAIEARILGCLAEKEATTPDAYPLTLNSLVVACNQKTSREPVMNLNPRCGRWKCAAWSSRSTPRAPAASRIA